MIDATAELWVAFIKLVIYSPYIGAAIPAMHPDKSKATTVSNLSELPLHTMRNNFFSRN